MGQRQPTSAESSAKLFQRQRTRAAQEENSQQQQAREAIARRFAAQGLSASGAQIKTEQVSQRQGQEALAKRLEDVDSREQVENIQRSQIEEQRAFQKAERESGQEFAGAQAAEQREFAKLEAEAQRKFQAGERLSSQEFAALETKKARDVQQTQFGKQFGLAEKQLGLAQDEFESSKAANAVNALISGINSKLNTRQIGAALEILGYPVDAKTGTVTIGGQQFPVFQSASDIVQGQSQNKQNIGQVDTTKSKLGGPLNIGSVNVSSANPFRKGGPFG